MPLTFPTLMGQGWSVHKKPRFDTRVAVHGTGREGRARKYYLPLWDFELTFDGLDMTAAGIYGSLGPLSMQTLAGFFEQMLGRYNDFLYVDPSDSVVVGGSLGVGDGTTTAFTIVRNLGGFVEPVGYVVSMSAVYLNGVSVGGWTASEPNTLTFAAPPPAGASVTADFTFAFVCRFSDDVEDFEEFMSTLSAVKSLKFQSVRRPAPFDALAPA